MLWKIIPKQLTNSYTHAYTFHCIKLFNGCNKQATKTTPANVKPQRWNSFSNSFTLAKVHFQFVQPLIIKQSATL